MKFKSLHTELLIQRESNRHTLLAFSVQLSVQQEKYRIDLPPLPLVSVAAEVRTVEKLSPPSCSFCTGKRVLSALPPLRAPGQWAISLKRDTSGSCELFATII